MFDEFENQKEELVLSEDRIICTLLNRKRNEELLRSIPYTPIHDMAVIYRYLIGETTKGVCTRIITNRMLEAQGMDKASLLSPAVKNTARLYPCKVELLSDTIANMFPSGFTSQEEELLPFLKSEEGQSEAGSMYLLTNQSGILGAAVITYPDILEQLAEKLQSSLIVIPSSVHEVLVIKASMPVEEATRILREVNSSCLKENEILSDTAMYFPWGKDRKESLYENTSL
ncbi:MAG: hypothetical protein K0R00_2626 [Herbinix sp.]|nr:hypothetical protein [Herbinix sp.]